MIHDAHANAVGTDGSAVDGVDARAFGGPPNCGGRFARKIVLEVDLLRPEIDVRQGIARRRRHVAPARPLC